MPVKIRLQRHGKKGKPYFHIVVADARSPRDGKYIERLGFYNPNTNPATIDIDVDGAVKWLGNGAQPTDTARAILSYKGVLYKNHLLKGVKKGAFSEEEMETRFTSWMDEKAGKIDAKKDGLVKATEKANADRLKAEAEVKEARAASIAAANAPVVEEAVEETAAEAEANVEDSVEEAVAEGATATETAQVAEAAVEEAAVAEEEAPVAEEAAPVAEETPAEEAPAAEAKAEDAKAEEAETEEEKKEGEA